MLQTIEAVMEVDVVFGVFAEFGLLGLTGLGVKLLVILLNILFGGQGKRELPLIGGGID